MIKIALIIIVLTTNQLVSANDSIYKKPVINIYLADESRRRTFLKLPNVKKAELVFRGNEWHGLTRGWRKFYQLQFNDTGILKFFLYSVSMFTNTSIPKTEKLLTIPINFTGERWLYVSSSKKKLAKMKNKPLQLMSTEEFKIEYETAYKKFINIGIDSEFINVALNVEPNRNED